MTDHYVAYLEHRLHVLTEERDAAKVENDVLVLTIDAMMTVHRKCTADTCATIAAIELVGS